MAKGLLGRLIKKTAQKATKKVVKKATPKTTTAAKQAAVRARARKAAKTKVNIPKAGRKVGQQATLNGKTVYWGGKDWGWQSKASLTKIENGTKKTPPAKPNTTKLPVSKSDNSPEVTRTRTKSVERSKKDQGYESREDRLATNRALNRKPKKVTDKKGVTASEPQPTSRQYTRGSEPKSTTKTTETKGVKAPKPKAPVTASQRLTAKQRQRRLTTKNRDIGAKAAAARIDNTKGGASVARGDIRSTSRGGVETSTLKGADSRGKNQRKLEQRRASQLGKDADKGRKVQLSAADARAAADQYEIDKAKEIQRISRTMSGRAASDYRKKATKEMRREAAVIRKNARTRSLTTRTNKKNNASPSHSSQNPKDLKGNASSRRSLRDTEKEGVRLSKDMDQRKANGQLRPTKTMGERGGLTASTKQGVKTAKPTGRTAKITTKSGDSTITKPTPTKSRPNSSKSSVVPGTPSSTEKIVQTGSVTRKGYKGRPTKTDTSKIVPKSKTKSKAKPKKKSEPSTDPRTNNSRSQAKRTMDAVRARKKVRDAGRAALDRETQAAFNRGASGQGTW